MHETKYLIEWATTYNFVKKSRKGEKFAICKTCGNNFGIAYGRENNIKGHLETSKYKSNITSLKSSHSLTHGVGIIYRQRKNLMKK